MMLKRILTSLFMLCLLTNLSAETLKFLFVKGEKYRYVATINEKTLLNGKLVNFTDYLNKFALEVIDARGGSGTIAGLYQISYRLSGDTGSFSLQEEYKSEFSIDSQGRHTIDPEDLYPMTRNIPLFPSADIKPGFTWTAAGEEVHDLKVFGIEAPFKFPVTVKYIFRGMKTIDNKSLAEISYSYSFYTKVTAIFPRTGFYPVKMAGEIENTIYFDITRGKPHSFEEHFDVVYQLSTGDTEEFIGINRCMLIEAPPLDKSETTAEINKDIEREKLKDVRVEDTDQGVKIVLENIQFEPDSDVITAPERAKIQTIASILKKYPNRDIRIIGHTADIGTPESCLELSQRRGKAVGDFLLKLGARQADQMTIIGKGATQPLATNATEEGRIKNRRVEIIILEN